MKITLALRPALRAILASRATRRAPFLALMLLAPTATHTQTRSCPRLARVPGYGSCANIGGNTCGFCTYRCNDDTVVSWNVCGG